MSLTPTVPPFLPSVLGEYADVRDIPEEQTLPTGQLNFKQGYPPETALPPQSGGIAPQREDFNAVNKLFSQHHVYQQAGGVYPWQNTLDYIKGCHVLGSDGKEYVALSWTGPGSVVGYRDPVDQAASGKYWHCYTDDIATNTADIATNTANIATNTSAISTLTSRIDDVTNWSSTADMHNNIYRGANLLGDGHFASIAAIMTAVRAGNFDDIYVGDYIPASITVDGTTSTVNFRVAAINLLNARYVGTDYWGTTDPNLCIVPDTLGTAQMNSTNTTEGGYVGSEMYTTVLPKYYTAIAGKSGTPFYGYLRTTMERLSKGISTTIAPRGSSSWTGAVNSVANYASQNLTLMSNSEVFGTVGWSSSQWDEETIATQLPMFQINPKSITLNGTLTFWLRSVADSACFCGSGGGLYTGYSFASYTLGVRPRFFIA